MAHGPKLSAEDRKALIEFLSGGLPLDVAARLIGHHEETVRNWRAQDKTLDNEIRFALAVGEAALVARVSEGGRNWRAAAWMLERLYPERYAPREVEEDEEDEVPNSMTGL